MANNIALPAHQSSQDHSCHTGHDVHQGQNKHHGHSVEMFQKRFWTSLLLTIPTLLWGTMLHHAFGFSLPRFAGSQWIAPVFASAVFLYGGRVFLQGAVHELRARLAGMMTLIALALSVAFAFSVATLLGFSGMPLWEELSTLVTIMLLGHWVEMRSIDQAQGAMQELTKLLPSTALRIEGEQSQEVPLSELRPGDLVLIRPGARIPADGQIAQGQSEVNESMLTGEAAPVAKQPGERVIAGTVNGAGSLRVQITAAGEQTALAAVMRMVAQAQASRSRVQALADKAAFILTLIALSSGVLTLAGWLLAGASLSVAIERMVTVLVITCPHALGLAIPLVLAISTTLGAKAGLLVRDRKGLENARKLDMVVFDKTGTLTQGQFGVVRIETEPDLDSEKALALAASVESDSEHPIAKALVRSAKEKNLPLGSTSQFKALPGLGTRALVEDKPYSVGGPALLQQLGLELSESLKKASEQASLQGQSTVYLVQPGKVLAAFMLADVLRKESKQAIEQLTRQKVQVAMLTGDSHLVANAVARELGIEQVFSGVLPSQKADIIEHLKRQGKQVAMVGDGVNDAPALASSDVGFAIGAGTDVAVEAGHIVLVRSDPRDVPKMIALSRASYRKMLENLVWATGYNVLAIPLAAGALTPLGWSLSPALGAVLMSVSTVVVALNAQLLRRFSGLHL